MADIKHLEHEYMKLRNERLHAGKFMLKPTKDGYWGISALHDLHDLFHTMDLKNSKSFIDLGSGDGRVVLMASLFTDATGIESDQELMQMSTRVRNRIGMPATFMCADYLKEDLSKFDTIFVHPDNNFDKLEPKLLAEMKENAKLVVYNNVYRPSTLKLHKELNVNGMPVGIFKK